MNTLIKVLSHPGHRDSKGRIEGNWICFSSLRKSQASSVLKHPQGTETSPVTGDTELRNT